MGPWGNGEMGKWDDVVIQVAEVYRGTLRLGKKQNIWKNEQGPVAFVGRKARDVPIPATHVHRGG